MNPVKAQLGTSQPWDLPQRGSSHPELPKFPKTYQIDSTAETPEPGLKPPGGNRRIRKSRNVPVRRGAGAIPNPAAHSGPGLTCGPGRVTVTGDAPQLIQIKAGPYFGTPLPDSGSAGFPGSTGIPDPGAFQGPARDAPSPRRVPTVGTTAGSTGSGEIPRNGTGRASGRIRSAGQWHSDAGVRRWVAESSCHIP